MSMVTVNQVFNPLLCGAHHGYFDPPRNFRKFARQHPELLADCPGPEITSAADGTPETMARVVNKVHDVAGRTIIETRYKRDMPGQDMMELPQRETYLSPLTGRPITRLSGDCEDLAALQKLWLIEEGMAPKLLRFVLARETAARGRFHMLLCVIAGVNSSILLDNRDTPSGPGSSYTFIGVETMERSSWAFCTSPSSELRALLGVDGSGHSLLPRYSSSLERLIARQSESAS